MPDRSTAQAATPPKKRPAKKRVAKKKPEFVVPPFPEEPIQIRMKSGWVVDVHYHLVQTVEDLEYMESCCEGKMIAYDTETSGLVPQLGARIAGHCVGALMDQTTFYGFYVPVRHIGPSNDEETQLGPEYVAQTIDRILSDVKLPVYTYHGKFERKMLRADGVAAWGRHHIDVSLLAQIYNENQRSFKMKVLMAEYGYDTARDEEKGLEDWMKKDARALKIPYKKPKVGSPDQKAEPTYLDKYGFSRSPIPFCGKYGIHDVLYTLYLGTVTYAGVAAQYPDLTRREHATGDILARFEWQGLPVCADELRRSYDLTKAERAHWLEIVRTEAVQLGGTIDDDFSATAVQLKNLLFKQIKAPEVRWSRKTKQPQVDKIARKLIAKADPRTRRLLEAVDKLQVVDKIYGTYAAGFLRHVSPANTVHPSYNQLERKAEGGAPVTGRLSSSDPNAQNVAGAPVHMHSCRCDGCVKESQQDDWLWGVKEPGEEVTVSVRRYFTVPEGKIRVLIDFSQIELRVLAWFCQDPTLLKAYREGIDVHQLIADELGISRKVAKQVNFGNSYGMTEIGLSQRMPGYYDDPEGVTEEAKQVLKRYFARYKNILVFRDMLSAQMRADNCMFVNPFGRPRRIPQIASKNRFERERAQRQMMSSIISGTAADLMKESMIRCQEAVDQWEGVDMVQQIHDEVVFDLPKVPGWLDQVKHLKGLMEDWPMFSHPTDRVGVPIQTSVEITTTTWADKREIEFLPNGQVRFAA